MTQSVTQSTSSILSRERRFIKLPLLIGFLATLLLSSCSHTKTLSQNEQLQIEALYRVALSDFQNGRHPDSLKSLLQAKSIDADNYPVQMLMGLNYLRMNEYPLSESTFKEVCADTTPVLPDCWNNLAAVYVEWQRPQEASLYAQRASEVLTYSTPELAYANWARAKMIEKRYNEALELLKKARLRNPKACQINMLISRAQLQLGNRAEALRNSSSARSTCPSAPITHLWLAYVDYSVGKVDRSKRNLRLLINRFERDQIIEEAIKALDNLNKGLPFERPKI